MINWSFVKNDEKLLCKLTTNPSAELQTKLQVIKEDKTSDNYPGINFPLLNFLSRQFPKHLEQYYLLVEGKNGLLALAALQLVDFSFFDYINEKRFENEKSFRNIAKRILYKPGKLFDGKILVLGHLLLSGVKTTWISDEFPEHMKEGLWPELLESAVDNYFNGVNNFSSLSAVANGVEISNPCFSIKENWKSVEIYPVMNLYIKDEWTNFSHYFDHLRSRYKKKVRSIREKSNELKVKELTLKEVEENQDLIMTLFKTVLDASTYKLLEPDSDFFAELMKMDGLDYHLCGVYFEGKMIAFFSWFNYDQVTEGHYLGYNKTFSTQFDLYKFLLLNLIEIAIESKSLSLVLGRTATIVKADLGAVPIISKILIRPIGELRKKLFPIYYKLFFRSHSLKIRNVFH